MDPAPPEPPLADLASWASLAGSVADQVLGRPRQSLAELVARTSYLYTRAREDFAPTSGRDALQARLRFFLARDLPKLAGPVHELALAGALPSGDRWRVLDLGAGLGTTTFSFLRGALAAGARPAAVEVDAIDQTAEALQGFRALAERAGEVGLPPLEVRAHTGDVGATLRRLEGGASWDVILLGLFVNELPFGERLALLETLRPLLSPEGTLLLLEPALRETTRALHRLRDAVAGEWTVFAPCIRTGPCPMLEGERDWCHEEERLALPSELEAVARAAGLRGDRLRYSYLTLRRDARRLADHTGADTWRVVSQPLKTKGKLEIYGCAQQGRVRLTRLDRHASEVNEPFGDARRGQVLALEGAEPKGQGLRVAATTRVERRR